MARSTADADPPVVASRTVVQASAYPAWAGWLAALFLALGTFVVVAGEHVARHADDHSGLAIWLGFAAVARGINLRRPLLLAHLGAAVLVLLLSGMALERGDVGLAQVGVVLAGVIVAWPPPAPEPATGGERRRIARLVDLSANDPLAPFALRADKSYLPSPDGRAAVAYRVRFGVAVVAGDPVGAPDAQAAAAEAMLDLVAANGWRLGVLGASERWAQWWQANGYRAVPIGRDVVIDVRSFGLTGRAFRNLRQAVQRTRNAGVTTAIYEEAALPPELRQQLQALVASSRRNAHRGFSMILDGLLEPGQLGRTIVAVAFDRDHRPVAFHRFGIAGGGSDISQDLPWRAVGAPNGVDERLAHDTVLWAREHGAERLSLSFAAFPELYETSQTTVLGRVSYWASHRLDRYIRLESLYRYLRKFRALADQRFVLLRLQDLLPVAAAMLSLEFSSVRGEAVAARIRRLLPGRHRRPID